MFVFSCLRAVLYDSFCLFVCFLLAKNMAKIEAHANTREMRLKRLRSLYGNAVGHLVPQCAVASRHTGHISHACYTLVATCLCGVRSSSVVICRNSRRARCRGSGLREMTGQRISTGGGIRVVHGPVLHARFKRVQTVSRGATRCGSASERVCSESRSKLLVL